MYFYDTINKRNMSLLLGLEGKSILRTELQFQIPVFTHYKGVHFILL